MMKTMWLQEGLHSELGQFLKRITGSPRPDALTAMLQWQALTGYRGRSSGVRPDLRHGLHLRVAVFLQWPPHPGTPSAAGLCVC